MFIGAKNKLIFSISSKNKNYFKLNSSKAKIKICNLKKGQELTIVGLSGSKDEDRTFTAEENLEVISGMKPTNRALRRLQSASHQATISFTRSTASK